MLKNCRKNKLGFTLLELLVVVLIIGILAGIALPQYQMAVGKAKFSTLKNLTKSLQQAAQRYYLVNNEYPKEMSGLDIGLNLKKEEAKSWSLEITTTDNIICDIWTGSSSDSYVACHKVILGKEVYFYIIRETGSPHACIIEGEDTNKTTNRLCRNETNKSSDNCAGGFCRYYYY